jgi:tRNA(fMet)-specific endonuclease VapC
MGLILDTDILIRAEKAPEAIDFSQWASYGSAFISAVTCSELLVGVHRADTDARRVRRSAFVERILTTIPSLAFDIEVARVHAELLAALPRNVTLGAHDLIIGATALRYGYPILTGNVGDFNRMAGVRVLEVSL